MIALRRLAGFTLIEVIIFIVIVSVGLMGVLSAFNIGVAKSADPMVASQVLRIAEATMQEVLQKQYQNDSTDPDNTSATLGCTVNTTAPKCTANTPAERANYNDVDDYSGFSQTGIKQLDGTTAVSGLENYTVTIAIDKSVAATLGSLTGGVPNQVKKITVTVSSGNQSIALTGYRSNYGY
jgi:MSHA pilin protein MshD